MRIYIEFSEKLNLKGVEFLKIFKRLKFMAAFVLSLLLMQNNALALGDSERINWFFKSKGDNSRPEILGGNDIAAQYGALYLGPEGDKTVYLTFDAGYSNEHVEKTLDVLNEHSVKAAFFILPGIIKNSPDVVKRMADDGHLVCNHTTSHGDMSKVTNIEDFKAELNGLEAIYSELTGKEMEKYFRPPEGSFSVNTLKFCQELGYTPVFWSFAYADWDNSKQPETEKSKLKILNSAHDGMVLLLHPTSQTNAEILGDVITELKARGYSFGTLHELKEKQTL